jgi:hypothetical protein
VVRATEEFASDFRDQSKKGSDLPIPAAFLPVIVTNAALYTARYNPKEVSLETGEFAEMPREIEEVSCVRFQKAFTATGGRDLGERSVFVIRAMWLPEFLGQVSLSWTQPAGSHRVYLPDTLWR